MPKFFNQYTDEIFIFFLELPVNKENRKERFAGSTTFDI